MHVHLFRHSISGFENEGHEVKVLSREKDITVELLDVFDIKHTPLSRTKSGQFGTEREWIPRAFHVLNSLYAFDPDVAVSRLNPATIVGSQLVGCPIVVFDQSERDGWLQRFLYTQPTQLHTPRSFQKSLGDHHHRYDGFHELAYLHPNRFDPDPEALREHGVEPTDTYSVLRFVAWDAHHDSENLATSAAERQRLVEFCSQYGSVYVSSEIELDDGYEIPVPPHLLHQLLYFADLHVSDSGTTPIEAGLLGTPTLCFNALVNEFGIYRELVDDYGAIIVENEVEAIETRIEEIVDSTAADGEWSRTRDRIAGDKIDLTEYIMDAIAEVGSS